MREREIFHRCSQQILLFLVLRANRESETVCERKRDLSQVLTADPALPHVLRANRESETVCERKRDLSQVLTADPALSHVLRANKRERRSVREREIFHRCSQQILLFLVLRANRESETVCERREIFHRCSHSRSCSSSCVKSKQRERDGLREKERSFTGALTADPALPRVLRATERARRSVREREIFHRCSQQILLFVVC